MLCVELGQEGQHLNNQTNGLDSDTLLALLKNMPEQALLKMLQLPDWSGVIHLTLAPQHCQDGVLGEETIGKGDNQR